MKISLEFLALFALAGERAAAHPNPGPITAGPTTCGGNPCSDAVAAVPTCAVPCLDGAASVVSCGTTDYACLCSASDAVVDAAQNCVINSCGIPRAIAVGNSVQAVCSCVTENPTTPCPQATPSVTSPNDPVSIPPSSIPLSSLPTGGGGKESDSTRPGTPTTCAGRDCGAIATTAIPGCAQPCFVSAAPNIGCGAADLGCQCQPDAQSSLGLILGPCLSNACGTADLGAILDGASSVCACATGPCTTPTGLPGTTSEPNRPTTISGTAPTLTFPPTTGSGSDSENRPTTTSRGNGSPSGGGLSPGGGALAGDSGSGSSSGGDSDGGNSGSGSGSGSSSETGADSESGDTDDSGSDTGPGTGAGAGAGTGTGAGGGGAGGMDANQTMVTGSMAEPTIVTAGASGRSEFGVIASIAGAVLFAALTL